MGACYAQFNRLCYVKPKKHERDDCMEYTYIKTQEDIEAFLEKSNSLHDGYIIGVQFVNEGIIPIKSGYRFEYDKRNLILRILVTSIWDALVEIEFEGVWEWKIHEEQWAMTDTTILLQDPDHIVWADDIVSGEEDLKRGSYIIAQAMKWRIVE